MSIYVWDLPVRLFHWLLAAAVLGSYVTGSLGGLWLDWHGRLGVFILALIVFRIAWGWLGSTYARFSSFFPTPRRLQDFFAARWQGPGHNPLGALSVLALLGLTLAQAVLGLFAMNDEIEFYGPLSELLSATSSSRAAAWHVWLFNLLLFFIILHLLAIAYYRWVKGKDLLRPMFNGKVRTTQAARAEPARGGGLVNFSIAVAIAAVVFFGIDSGLLACWLAGRGGLTQCLAGAS